MIISASRRTDIPAYYSDWLVKRLEEGYAVIPNPRNPKRAGKVTLSPDNVDCIVFWTKNPAPMLKKLSSIKKLGYRYYMQFTLTPYGKDVEAHLPKKTLLVNVFRHFSEQISPELMVWRYDPILIDSKHTIDWHKTQFSKMCEALDGYTNRCVISFIDSYKSMSNVFRVMSRSEIDEIAASFAAIARSHGISLYTCAEEYDLSRFDIKHSACIDKDLVELATGYSITAKKDANQRAACCCITSVDIGVYDTCAHGCTYCYATTSSRTVFRNMALHNMEAPMITGFPRKDLLMTDRTTLSQRINQPSLF